MGFGTTCFTWRPLIAVVMTASSVAVGLAWATGIRALTIVPICGLLIVGVLGCRALRRRHQALELLYEATRLLHSSASFEAGLEAVLARTRAAFGAELAVATLFPTAEGAYRIVVGAEAGRPTMTRIGGAEVDLLTFQVLSSASAVRVAARRRGDRRVEVAGVPVTDAMVAPMRGEQGTIGTISVANREASMGTFTRDDLQLFETLADHAGAALEYMRLDRELAQLTELLSERRRLEEHMRGVQKLEAVGRLAGGVAHEFNNLLTAISGYSEILLGSLTGEERRHAEEIAAASARAARLTHQLLVFSRKEVVRPVVLDPNDVIEQLEPMLRSMLGERIEVVTELEPQIDQVLIDADLLREAFLNLAINAKDAMGGDGMLTVRTRTVTVGDVPPGDAPMPVGRYTLVSVTDTGTGMDEETRSRAFEPFFTTKEIGEGTGLGLASVYGIVKQSGGYVFARSRPGRGARFDIYLPPAERSAIDLFDDPEPTKRGCIMLVEDEPAVRGVIQAMLERANFDVIEAADGHQALALGANSDQVVDLLVTDTVMPGMSGRALYEALVRESPDLRVLYMSGYPSGAMGAYEIDPRDPFIQKPFSAADLIQRAEQLIARPLALAGR
jgi:signal transduction histidine kinase/CheY-like chemotaxis protein